MGELKWLVEKNNFLSHMECHAIINRIIKKYQEKELCDFDYYFNDQLTEETTQKIEKNWKIDLTEDLS